MDGDSHLGRERQDANRQLWIEKQGAKVLRFWNTDVFESREAVFEAIWRECESRQNR